MRLLFKNIKMSLQSQIESLLFVSSQPVSVARLARATGVKPKEAESALAALAAKYRREKDTGMMLVEVGEAYQLVTHGANAAVVADFLKSDVTGELSEPSLETLTIIAYRGPMSKAELEQIRGVNCSLILRNLLMRGLVTRQERAGDIMWYQVSADFVRFLGLSGVKELPDYAKLHNHETLAQALQMTGEEADA